MLLRTFKKSELKKLFKPKEKSSGEDNGLITIIGGSELFHGAPLLSLKVASRIVDMVFFATPEKSVGYIAEQIKSKLLSFIWVPWDDVDAYIAKSDAVLIGPGLMRYKSEMRQVTSNKLKENKFRNSMLPVTSNLLRGSLYDNAGKLSRDITQRFLKKFPDKRWVIDGGSLQVMDLGWIPEGAILTPNVKEFEILLKSSKQNVVSSMEKEKSKMHSTNYIQRTTKFAKQYNCTIVLKGPDTIVASPNEAVVVEGGNPGLTKGGTGDVLAGLTVALLAKNDPFLAAAAASYIEKHAADVLYSKVGVNYNSDDLADAIPEVLQSAIGDKR